MRSVDNVPPLTVPVRGVIVRTICGVSILWGSAIESVGKSGVGTKCG